MNNFYQCFFLLCIIYLAGCTSLFEQPDYTLISKKSGSSEDTAQSQVLIDKSKTYELFFILPEREQRLKIEMKAGAASGGLEEELQPFFVAEKYYLVSVNGTGLDSYTVIGANHNSDWTLIEAVEIFTTDDDPLVQLTSGVYRLRFTVFDEAAFSYTMTVYSNGTEILFAPTLEEAKRKLAVALASDKKEN